MNKNEKRVDVLVYGTYRVGEPDYHTLIQFFDMRGCVVTTKDIKITGLTLYSKGFRPVAMRTTNPESFVICDLLSLTHLAYSRISQEMDKENCIEDTILFENAPAIIHLGLGVDLVKGVGSFKWDAIEDGDWKKYRESLFDANKKIGEYPQRSKVVVLPEAEMNTFMRNLRNTKRHKTNEGYQNYQEDNYDD